jgi:hypothetical protein
MPKNRRDIVIDELWNLSSYGICLMETEKLNIDNIKLTLYRAADVNFVMHDFHHYLVPVNVSEFDFIDAKFEEEYKKVCKDNIDVSREVRLPIVVLIFDVLSWPGDIFQKYIRLNVDDQSYKFYFIKIHPNKSEHMTCFVNEWNRMCQ